MTYAKKLFEGVPKHHTRKSRFNLSHEWLHDFDFGKLVPVLCEPTMPGDEFEITTEFAFRFEPMYFPVMSMVNMQCNYFWVPNRILWRQTDYQNGGNGWVSFITLAGEYEHPYVAIDQQTDTTGSTNDTVMGYFGLPYTKRAVGWNDVIEQINALPLSAYLAIWDEYYRNPQVEPGRWFNLNPGDNTSEFDTAFENAITARCRVLSAKWEKDYFTSAIPTPQVGDPVKIPFVVEDPHTFTGAEYPVFKEVTTNNPTDAGTLKTSAAGEITQDIKPVMYYDPRDYAANMKQLRFAEKLQEFKERLMKVGQRYRDYIKGMFGNDPQPGSVDVPVWFGYYQGRVQVSDVMQTATTQIGETQYNVGDYAGRMDMYERGRTMRVYCAEHGWIIAILEVKPRTSYGQGIDRWWRWMLPTDYPLEIFASIGDQEIKKEEILYNAKSGQQDKNSQTFGYIPRYSEMRYRNSKYGSNLQAQSWGLSLHFGRWWDPENTVDTVYDRLEINKWFVNTEERTGGGIEGSLRTLQIFKSLPTLFNNEPTQNPIFGHLFHNVFVNRNLPLFSTPKLA